MGQLADRWTVLMNELDRYKSGHYPDLLCVEILRLVREAEHLLVPDPFEAELLLTARALVEDCNPKIAMLKLHEAIDRRLSGR